MNDNRRLAVIKEQMLKVHADYQAATDEKEKAKLLAKAKRLIDSRHNALKAEAQDRVNVLARNPSEANNRELAKLCEEFGIEPNTNKQKRREIKGSFVKQAKYAEKKFNRLKELNGLISNGTAEQKISAQQAKTKYQANNACAYVETVVSHKGLWNPEGTKQTKGKQKVKKSGYMPKGIKFQGEKK